MKQQVKAGAFYRVSSDSQESRNQVPDVEAFAGHHGYDIAQTYTVSDTAWKDGGGAEYRAALQQALDDAWAGKFSVVIVWALDRIVRDGAEDALRIIRQFKERGCTLVSVKESWLNGSPEVQDVLVAFAGWMAKVESQRKSDRVKAGLARRAAEGKPIGGKPGRKDKKPRKRSGYVAAWEPEGARRRPRVAGLVRLGLTATGLGYGRALFMYSPWPPHAEGNNGRGAYGAGGPSWPIPRRGHSP